MPVSHGDEPVPATPDKILTTADPASGLQGTLRLERADDDGLSAIVVDVRNPTARSVSLRVNTDPSAFLMVGANDDRGRQLSRALRKFTTDEPQSFDIVTLEPGAHRSWTTPLADWISGDRIPDQEGLAGRIVVNVAFIVTSGRGDELSMLTFYDHHVRFTRRGLDVAP